MASSDNPAKYHVEKHVTIAMYHDLSDRLKRDGMRRLWSNWSCLNDQKSLSSFWVRGSSPPKGSLIPIGSLEYFDSLGFDEHSIVEGGGTYTRNHVMHNSTLDTDFYTYFSSGSRDFGYYLPEHYFCTLSKQWLCKIGVPSFQDILEEQLKILDEASPYYGLVDYTFSNESYAGFVHGQPSFMTAPLSQYVHRCRWLKSWSQGERKLKGLYWGNYYSDRFMESLGGRSIFVSRYRQWTTSNKSAALVWEMANGVFLSLCRMIHKVEPGVPLDGSASQNMQWLINEMDSRGLLL